MSTFAIQRKIARFSIFRPGMPLKQWLNQQTDKPDILLNCSLYTAKGVPCGTIWEGGKLVNNEGKGFGFGTTDDKTVDFAGPWDKAWKSYVTGYYGVVQEGKAVPAPWVDRYVFDKALSRIAFGRLKTGQYAVFCANGMTISAFADAGARAGFESLCNLDGGGSRALYWLGSWVYTSTRMPYNAIAIWLEEPKQEPEKEGFMQVICTQKTNTYDASGKKELGRYIDKGDVCQLSDKIRSTLQAEIVYPAGRVMRTAYIKDLANFQKASGGQKK